MRPGDRAAGAQSARPRGSHCVRNLWSRSCTIMSPAAASGMAPSLCAGVRIRHQYNARAISLTRIDGRTCDARSPTTLGSDASRLPQLSLLLAQGRRQLVPEEIEEVFLLRTDLHQNEMVVTGPYEATDGF